VPRRALRWHLQQSPTGIDEWIKNDEGGKEPQTRARRKVSSHVASNSCQPSKFCCACISHALWRRRSRRRRRRRKRGGLPSVEEEEEEESLFMADAAEEKGGGRSGVLK